MFRVPSSAFISDLRILYGLSSIRYSLFAIRYSLFTIHYSLFTVHCSLILRADRPYAPPLPSRVHSSCRLCRFEDAGVRAEFTRG